ncbi:hypothetical protein ES708_25467 [subsurface metagenome]
MTPETRHAATTITAILCTTAMVIFSMYKGIDGAVLMSGLAIVGGLGGYAFRSILNSKGKDKS